MEDSGDGWFHERSVADLDQVSITTIANGRVSETDDLCAFQVAFRQRRNLLVFRVDHEDAQLRNVRMALQQGGITKSVQETHFLFHRDVYRA